MPIPISVLLFDDKLDYCRQLRLSARISNIDITYKHSWDNALEELSENHSKYKFVILDAKSFLREDQKEGSESIDSVIRAMTDIRKLEGQVKHPIPFCINTGYAEHAATFEATTHVFEKGSDTEKLFKYILDEVNLLPETKIKNDFFKVFETFEYGYFERNLEIELINIIKRVNSIGDSTEKSVLRDMRPFLEAVFNNMIQQMPGFIPERIGKGRTLNLSAALKFIGGNPRFNEGSNSIEFNGEQFMPLHLYYLAKGFKDATSSMGMHYDSEPISRYFVLAQFNALMEILVWYKDFMDKNA